MAVFGEGMASAAVRRLLPGTGPDLIRDALKGLRLAAGVDRDELVEEVCADLVIALLSGRFCGYDPEFAAFEAYLVAAARNRALDILRSARRRPAPAGDGSQAPSCAGWADPVGTSLAAEIRSAVRAGLRTLREEDPFGAQILEAVHLQGMSYAELTERTGVSAPLLHLRAHRGRRRLARILRGSSIPARMPARGVV